MPGGVRRSIVAASVAAVAVAVLVAGLLTGATAGARPAARPAAKDCHAGVPPLLHDGFPEPPLLYSHGGRLEATLRAAVGPARMGGHRVLAWSYDGSVPRADARDLRRRSRSRCI